MKTIYLSASLSGVKNVPTDFLKKIVDSMKKEGYKVLSEHIVHGITEENFRVLSRNSGKHIPKREGYESDIRDFDMSSVDQADFVVALVDSPSHGVGMELERAILRPDRGLPIVPILCLVRNDNYPQLTAMIKGVNAPNFTLTQYADSEDAIQKIIHFLHAHS